MLPSGGVGFAWQVLGGRWAAQVSTEPLGSSARLRAARVGRLTRASRAKSVREFLAEWGELQGWLASETAELEARSACLSHWGTPCEHVGLVMSCEDLSGEMHLKRNGELSYFVERGVGEPLLLDISRTVSGKEDFLRNYERFRSAILGEDYLRPPSERS